MNVIKHNDFIADKPVSIEKEDKFQRFNFSRRIADTIIKSQSDKSLVIGIYGEWGEGKTSVINFIDSELSKDNTVIRIEFNPWRYSDENSLLISFFNKIAKALNVQLLKKRESLGRSLEEKSEYIGFDIPTIGDVSKVFKSLGKWLGTVDLEELKERLNGIIIESKKKLVIFIDDIDRLDKNEIYSVFRLVKLTADFSNTTYVLAFDEKVVSSAIGDRFGSSDNHSGHDFLEKIIQVPLHLPKVQSNALRKYCFETIEHIINTNDFEWLEDEAIRFVSFFTTHLLGKFTTPRTIVRYSNSLLFSLPLLKNEANLTDLMIIEAIKIIYPNIYNFIRENPHYFIIPYTDFLGKQEEKKKESTKVEIDNLCQQYTKKEKSNILELLQKIFPLLENVYKNITFSNSVMDSWHKDKRIASARYFNRYFTYCVIKGEMSDVSFDQFINELSILSGNELVNEITKLIDSSSPENFMYKLRDVESELNWDSAKKLINILSIYSELLPNSNSKNNFLNLGSARIQAEFFIYESVKLHANSEEQLVFVKELMKKTVPIEFALNLLHKFNPKGKRDNVFTVEQFEEIWKSLLIRILKEAENKDVFDIYHPDQIYIICKYWEGFGREEFNDYIHAVIDRNPEKVMRLLRTYLPRFRTLGKDKYVDQNLDQKSYKYLVSVIDKDYLMESLKKVYSINELTEKDDLWEKDDDENLSDLKLAKQFYHWYSLDNLTT